MLMNRPFDAAGFASAIVIVSRCSPAGSPSDRHSNGSSAAGAVLVDLDDRPVVDADLGDAGVVEAEADPADARPAERERGRVAGPVVEAEGIRLPPAVAREPRLAVRMAVRVEVERSTARPA